MLKQEWDDLLLEQFGDDYTHKQVVKIKKFFDDAYTKKIELGESEQEAVDRLVANFGLPKDMESSTIDLILLQSIQKTNAMDEKATDDTVNLTNTQESTDDLGIQDCQPNVVENEINVADTASFYNDAYVNKPQMMDASDEYAAGIDELQMMDASDEYATGIDELQTDENSGQTWENGNDKDNGAGQEQFISPLQEWEKSDIVQPFERSKVENDIVENVEKSVGAVQEGETVVASSVVVPSVETVKPLVETSEVEIVDKTQPLIAPTQFVSTENNEQVELQNVAEIETKTVNPSGQNVSIDVSIEMSKPNVQKEIVPNVRQAIEIPIVQDQTKLANSQIELQSKVEKVQPTKVQATVEIVQSMVEKVSESELQKVNQPDNTIKTNNTNHTTSTQDKNLSIQTDKDKKVVNENLDKKVQEQTKSKKGKNKATKSKSTTTTDTDKMVAGGRVAIVLLSIFALPLFCLLVGYALFTFGILVAALTVLIVLIVLGYALLVCGIVSAVFAILTLADGHIGAGLAQLGVYVFVIGVGIILSLQTKRFSRYVSKCTKGYAITVKIMFNAFAKAFGVWFASQVKKEAEIATQSVVGDGGLLSNAVQNQTTNDSKEQTTHHNHSQSTNHTQSINVASGQSTNVNNVGIDNIQSPKDGDSLVKKGATIVPTENVDKVELLDKEVVHKDTQSQSVQSQGKDMEVKSVENGQSTSVQNNPTSNHNALHKDKVDKDSVTPVNGQKVDTDTKVVNEKIFCQYCGKPMSKNVKFCMECGKPTAQNQASVYTNASSKGVL